MMKKFLTICLAALLAFGCACAFAEGAMYDQPINFAEFTFGQSNASIRETTYYEYMSFYRNYCSSRTIADPAGMLITFTQPEAADTVYFEASIGQREVAGHEASAMLYFACNEEDEGYLAKEANAKLFAGNYYFYGWEEELATVFEDLKSKLSKVYGEPNMTAASADEIWGAPDFSGDESMASEYERLTGEYQPMTFVVWKSSANGTMVVLSKYNQYGNDAVNLYYFCPEAEPVIAAQAGGSSTDSDDLSGL